MKAGSNSRRIAIALGVVLALATVPLAALALDGPPRDRAAAAGTATAERAAGAELRGFGSCAALGRYARRHAEAATYPVLTGGDAATPAPTAPGADAGAESAGSTTSSATNVQEPGIDEPDIVKAAGSRVFAIANGKLRAIDVGGEAPVELGAIALGELAGNAAHGYDHQLMLAGDRLLLITQTSGEAGGGTGAPPGVAAPDIAYFGEPRTVLSEVDVSDPAAMSVVRTLRVEGGFVNARQIGATARVVVSSFPQYAFAEPRASSKSLIPSTTLRDNATGAVERGRLLGCRKVRRPRGFSGLELLSVLTIDLASGLEPADVDTIMTRGETVYSSAESLYVATERWIAPDASEHRIASVTTEIHKFALGSPTETEHVASGSVPGFMLSQWALSEQDGLLRVASTAESPELDFGERESFVTILGQSGEKLREVGSVDGLGRGERIYAVRFIGDVGYVVTFRQVDPLYTVDLSEPADPRVVGELKVPGYSAYLHPIGDGLLLGVGQAATDEGRTLGTQVSLFDVGNLAAPSSLDRVGFGEGSSSEVEYDHHAFLHDPASGLVVIPLEDYGARGAQFSGAVGLRVGPAGIEEVARISHAGSGGSDTAGETGQPAPVRRSLVAGPRLYTVSEAGIAAHDPLTLSEQAFLGFD